MSFHNPAIRRALEQMADQAGDSAVRLDANETAWVEREVTQIRNKLFEIVYAELKAMSLVPLATDISADILQYVYFVLDTVGEAKIIANASDDLPRVDVSKTERQGIVRPLGASFGWDIFEMRLAARLGQPLNQQKADACRKAIARQIDKLLSSGVTDSQTGLGMEGLLTNADVVALGIVAGTLWVLGTTTAATMIALLNSTAQAIVTATNEAFIPDTAILPTQSYGVMAATPYGVDSDVTALGWFLKNSPYIKNVIPWYRGNGAGASSTNRGLVYKRDPEVLEGVVPLLFEALPPQARGLEMIVPCVAKCGGVKIYHPEACRYIDFALS
jgi:hypothetical protein